MMLTRISAVAKLSLRCNKSHNILIKNTKHVNTMTRYLSTDSPIDDRKDSTPSIVYYGLYSMLCYTGVYVGTFATIYMGLSSGFISAETFDIDQIESAAKMQEIIGASVKMDDGPQFQYLADASLINRYMKVPRVILTTGVSLLMSNTCGISLEQDEDGHKKIFASLFALTFVESNI